jgi:hypothetical protein
LPELGIHAPERLRPLLNTREAALLKAGPTPAVVQQWIRGSEAERRALLEGPLSKPTADDVDLGKLVSTIVAPDSAEWYASTSDLVRTMNWLRLHADRQALDILAINSGIPRTAVSDLAYVGYKGGSDAGVINMTLLIRDKAGGWHALSGTWNNPKGAVDEARFASLMSRATGLVK